MDTTLSDPLLGQVVDGRYQVESKVARGGMATVYLALDRRLDREVALKVMLPHLGDDAEFGGRFVREARAAARLSHPNVVQVFDQGSDGDLLYLAMEYLPGRTLRDVLVDRSAFTVREALTVLDPVLDALSAAHRAGIVHRDIKPENVILTDDGRVKVADFGLARAMSTAAATNSWGVILGTAAYLAPEVVTRGIADARADVYSCGIMLYEMLTGRQPFGGSDVAAVARQHVTEIVPLPSTLVPHLPAEVDHLVAVATASDPDGRPANAQHLLDLVRSTRQGLPEAAMDIRPTVIYPFSSFIGHNDYSGHTEVVPSSPFGPGPLAANVVVSTVEQHRNGTPPLTGAQFQAQYQQTIALPMLRPPERGLFRVPPQPARSLMQIRRRRGGIALGLVIALVAALTAVAWWFTGGPGAYTTAPVVVNQSAAKAVALLTAEGLAADQQPTYDDKVKAGVVISSDPQGGRQVRKGGTVTLLVSRGPQLFAVPELVGKKQSDAEDLLKQTSLKPGEVTRKYSDQIASGVVISVDPEPGTRLTRGKPVDLVVSKGTRPVEVPDFVGQQKDQVIAALDQLKLKSNVTDQQNDAPAGQVLSQDPPAGQTARVGDTVTLTVSQGPPMATVPDVTDKKFDEARQILEAAGFQVQRQGTDLIGRVFAQSPGAGEQVPANSVVVLTTV